MPSAGHPDVDKLLQQAAWVRQLAARLCADAHGADDATQDVWLAALQSPPRDHRSLRGWLATLVRNTVRLRHRGERRRLRREVSVTAPCDVHEPAADVAARIELHQRLVALVLTLPEPRRALVLRHYFDGEDVAAIAKAERSTPDAVRAHLRRARDELRARLDAEPRHRASLRVLWPTLGGAGVTTAAPAAATLAMTTLLKVKVAAAVAAVIAVVWIAWPSTAAHSPFASAPPPPPLTSVAASEAPDTVGAPPASRVLAADPRHGVAANGPVLRGRLRGLHPAAPWTTSVRLVLGGRAAAQGEEPEQEVVATPDAMGAIVWPLPASSTGAVGAWARVEAEDDNYRALDWRREGAVLPDEELVLDVHVVAQIEGRVVDADDIPVPLTRIAAFAIENGNPVDRVLAMTVSGREGRYTLGVPPATPVFVVAVPMAFRRAGVPQRGRNAIPAGGMARNDLVPASVTVIGAVGAPELGVDFRVGAAQIVTGRVRWTDGRPVADARVRSLPFEGATFSMGVRVTRLRGVLATETFTTTDANGEFELATGPLPIEVAVTAVDGHELVGPAMRTRMPPHPVELTLPQPVRVRAVDRAGVVPVAVVRVIDGERQVLVDTRACSLIVAPGRSATVQAMHGRLRSAVVPVSFAAAGTTVDLALDVELAELRVRLDGVLLVREVEFTMQVLPEGPSESRLLEREDRNDPFVLDVVPGRHRVRVSAGGGDCDGRFLLPSVHDVDVSASGGLVTVAPAFGGRMQIAATDAAGLDVAGTCVVHDLAGREITAGRGDELGVLPPGQYDVELRLGDRGTKRQRVDVRVLETTAVTIRLP